MIKHYFLTRVTLSVILVFILTSSFAQTCPTGLISYWRMDETSGLTLFDNTGSHHATSNNELAIDENSKVGTSHYFNTTSTYVGDNAVVPNSSAYSFPAGSSFSIVYWVKFTEVMYNGDDHVVISKGNWSGGSPTAPYWSSGTNGSGKFNFILQDSNGTRCEMETTNSGYNDGLWHQVVLVRDGASKINYIYVDGVVAKQQSVTYTGNFIVSNDIHIGNLLSGSVYSYYFKGSIDEVAIYNRALTSTDIANQINMANSGVGICDGFNPRISSLPKITAIAGTPYTATIKAAGLQTGMTFSLLDHPAGMTINATTGLITWESPALDDDGFVKVKADNGIAPSDTQSFRIHIAEGTVCPAGIITLLKLDENSGPIYADYYGSHNATGPILPSATSGILDGAQTFCSTTKIDIPDIGTEFDFLATSSFSYEYWLKSSNVATMVCLGRHRLDYSNTAFMYTGTYEDGTAAFELRDNGGMLSLIHGTTIITDGEWHHIVAVREEASNRNIIYVDGVLEVSAIVNYANSFIADNPTEINVGYLHRALVSEPEYHLIGSLDEITIYNRALSATEILANYNGGNPAGNCAAGNYAPVITSEPVVEATEEILYSYTFTTDDMNTDDVLTLSAVTKPSWLNFNWTPGQKSAVLSGTPSAAVSGNQNVTLRVSDGDLVKDQVFIIAVTNVNNAPVVTSIPELTKQEDVQYTYTLEVNDEDVADVISMSVVNMPVWLSFSHTTGTRTAILSGIPDDINIGNNPVDILISDGHVEIHHSFNISITSVNDLPVIASQSVLTTDEDTPLTLSKADFDITDEDNASEQITLSVLAGTNYTLNQNTVIPSPNYHGLLIVNLSAHDPQGESEVFHANITVNPVNDAPVFTSTPELTIEVGNLYAYILAASDVDNTSLVKTVVQKPDWLQFVPESGVLIGTPEQDDKVANNHVIIRVSDGNVSTDQSFDIVVEGGNAMQNLESAGIRIYPVPAREFLNIELESQATETSVDVISINGTTVAHDIIAPNQAKHVLSLRGLESGIYFLRIRNHQLNNIGRLIIGE